MNETEKFVQLKEKVTIISDQKIRIEERYNNSKAQLGKLVKEVTDKGYDPKKLSEIKEKKEKELKEEIEKLETEIEVAKKALDDIEQGEE